MIVGDVSIAPVIESRLALFRPEELFPRATPGDRLTILIQSHVVVSRGTVIVVDTCVGDDRERVRPEFHRQRWGWLDRLRTIVAPEDVDYVVTTHLHVDHVGGHTRPDGAPTFPRARYLIVRDEWAYWSSSSPEVAAALRRTGDYLADCIRPLHEAGVVDLVEADAAITDEVRLRPAPGETPGHVVVEIASRGARAVLSADVVHHPIQLRHPDWSTRFCTDPERSRRTRVALLEEWELDGALVLPAHFAAYEPLHPSRADSSLAASTTWGTSAS